MLDQVTSVFLTDAQGKILRIHGEEPSDALRALLGDLRQEQPAARRVGDAMALSVPLPQGRWCIWLLGSVPPLQSLSALLGTIRTLSVNLIAAGEAEGAARAVAPAAPLVLRPLAAALKGPLRRYEPLVQFLGEQLVLSGEASGLAAFSLKDGKVKNLRGSDAVIQRNRDLLRNLLLSVLEQPQESRPLSFSRETPAEAPLALEAGLILERGAQAGMHILLPEGDHGYGVILFDAPQPSAGLAAELPALLQLMRPLKLQGLAARRRLWLRSAGAVAALALSVFLLWPVPAKITLTGVAHPQSAVIAALTGDAVLDEMLVRTGEQVEEGQALARFRSTALAEQAAQERLTMAVEELNAQAAMAKNDYGAVRLHESRRDIARARLAEAEGQIERLTVRAAAAGRVISALPAHATGGGFSKGHEVARIQTGPGFLMLLTPSNVDARRLAAGMTGVALFRGLTDRDYRLEVISPPALVRDISSGEDRLELFAQITNPDGRLLAGLSGYARLEGETSPRILGLTHYMREYIRTVLWTYLGLRW